MERAARENPSTMLSIVGPPDATAAAIAERIKDVHVTFACSTAVAPRLEQIIGDNGVIQMARLGVAGGWHSPFMLPAAECFREALAGVRFAAWSGILGDNVTGG